MTAMAQLLLEIFSEEIPARMQARAAADLAQLVADGLTRHGLVFDAPQSHVTPRRLCLIIENLPTRTPDIAEERRGPRVGAPEAALEGFLKGAGVTLAECEQRDTGKGLFYFAVIARPDRPTALLLQEVIEQILVNFPWPKSMRWGSGTLRWVRPMQSLLCLFDGEIVPLRFGELTAGRATRGHRFLAPEPFEVADAGDYRQRLQQAKVVLDAEQRRQMILADAEQAAAGEGLILRRDDALLAEVAGLVEWPVVLVGGFDQDFMAVPDEALISSMRAHQKYFSLLKPDGRLANRFVMVANLPDGEKGAILAGNQRVLRARLSDARFFWEADRKQSLEQMRDRLADRLFYAGLGSMKDKSERLAVLSGFIAARIGADALAAERAGRFAKADLSSEMVGEFPELQGIMGRYYALAEGLDDSVATAIGSHYAPQGPHDSCPADRLTVALAIADKIDLLVGFFAIDERPTGSKDPFALRRAALGIIRLILENGLRLSLRELIARAHGLYATLPYDALKTELDLVLFFRERLKAHFKEQNISHDLIAAIAEEEDDLFRVQAKILALRQFLASEDGGNLLIAYRRATNIRRIEGEKDDLSALPAWQGGNQQEMALHQALTEAEAAIAAAGEDDQAAMAAMAKLRAPVDAFFDKVTVNSADPEERLSRLGLLGRVCEMMDRLADFSAIEG